MIFSIALVLTGCISIIYPPESSYNGLYLQMFDGSGFVAQENTNSYEECAVLAANVPRLAGGKLTMFCTKENHPGLTYKSTIKYPDGAIHDVLFTSNEACARYLLERAKPARVEVLNFCWPARL